MFLASTPDHDGIKEISPEIRKKKIPSFHHNSHREICVNQSSGNDSASALPYHRPASLALFSVKFGAPFHGNR